MRPARTFKIAIMLIAMCAAMWMLETLRRHQLASHQYNHVTGNSEVKVNTNDFILFESVTKYLFIAVSK